MADYKLNIDLQQGISGVKDLTASIDKLNQSIEQLGQKMNANMTKTATSTRAAKKSMSELNAELAELTRKYEAAYNKHPFTPGRRRDLDKYGREIKNVNAQIDKLKQKTDAAAASQGKLNKQVSLGRQLFLRLKSVMLTVFGAYAVIQGIRNTINAIKDFELATARLAAITGKTRDEIESLTDTSKALATTGIFDAKEITEVQVQLAKFGFTINEISNSTKGIIDLATATGEDLVNATTLVSSSIRALGLEASETTRLVDVLGKAFTTSALDVNKFRESAKFFLPIARQLGWSIEDVTATLGKLADSGISASLAGTGLRQISIQLLDTSSDLTAILGQNINTFKEFYDALDRAKDSGVSFNDVFNATPVRARSLLTVLWNSIDAIREYREGLDDVNGSISEMANVQMDTLAYQIERVDSAWKTLIISVQEGGGLMKDTLEGVADTLKGIAMTLNPKAFGMIEASKAMEQFKNNLKATGREGSLDAIRHKMGIIADEIKEAEGNLDDLNDQYDFLGLKFLKFTPPGGVAWLKYSADIGEATATLEKLRAEHELLEELLAETEVDNFLEKYIQGLETASTIGLDEIKKEILDGGVTQEEFDRYKDTYEKYLDDISILATDAFVRSDDDSVEFFSNAFARLKEYGQKQLALLAGDLSTYLQLLAEAQENAYKNQKVLLSLQEQLEIQRAENQIEEAEKLEIKLLEIKTKYAKLRLQLEINSGNLTQDQVKVANDLIEEMDKTLARERLEIGSEYREKERSDAEASWAGFFALEKARNETELQLLKNQGASKEELWKKDLENAIRLKEVEILLYEEAGKSAELLYEQLAKMQAELLGGFDSKEALKDVVKAYRDFAKEIIDSLQTIVDAQVDNTSRLVDDLDTRIAETQRSLDQEIELYAAGYASNVTAKKRELQELKNAREEALREREAAIRKQQTLEAIAQAVNLGTAVSNVIKTYSSVPGVGFAIAATVVAAFLQLFAQAQSNIKNITQFGSGGKVDGDSHANGGVIIEAEGGEFVIRKSAYEKYAPLVNAINEDDVPTINKNVLSSTTFNRKGDKVVVDNAIWTKMYNLWEKNLSGENVQIVGAKKISTRGIKKRITNV